MTVQELEDKVWAQDGIRIVVRDSANTQVKDYTHTNAAQASWRITEFLRKRIKPLLKRQEVEVIRGNGKYPHGRKLLSSIRESYKDG